MKRFLMSFAVSLILCVAAIAGDLLSDGVYAIPDADGVSTGSSAQAQIYPLFKITAGDPSQTGLGFYGTQGQVLLFAGFAPNGNGDYVKVTGSGTWTQSFDALTNTFTTNFTGSGGRAGTNLTWTGGY